jgi:hypothetical protein
VTPFSPDFTTFQSFQIDPLGETWVPETGTLLGPGTARWNPNTIVPAQAMLLGTERSLSLTDTDPALARFLAKGGVLVIGGIPVLSQGVALATVLDPGQSNLARGLAAAGLVLGVTGTLLEDVSAAIRFSQTTASQTFRNGEFAGQRVADVARGLRSGAISPSRLPINVVVRDGNVLSLNTRSTLALIRGGVSPSNWTVVNRTGNSFFESLLTEHLSVNGLTSAGSDVVRVTGGGAGVSISW